MSFIISEALKVIYNSYSKIALTERYAQNLYVQYKDLNAKNEAIIAKLKEDYYSLNRQLEIA